MDWIKIFTSIVAVITFIAFIYQIRLFVKTRDVYEGIWAILFWMGLMTFV